MSLEAVVDPSCTLSYGIVQPGEDYLDGLPVVRPTDLGAKLIHLDGLKRSNPKLAEGYRRTTLQGGELLLCVRGSTGVVSVAAPELRAANVTRGIVPVRFNSDYVLPELGYYLMKSEYVQSQIREKTYGAALMRVNIRDLRALTLLVPSLREQSLMALTMCELDTEVQRLTHLYERKLAALEELKKSLLQQAFSATWSMSRRDWTLFVADMREACDKIAAYTSGMDFEVFCADPRGGCRRPQSRNHRRGVQWHPRGSEASEARHRLASHQGPAQSDRA